MNVSAVLKAFQAATYYSRDSEVDLFRCLAQTIEQHSSAHFIDETHGNVAQVEYLSPIRGTQRCEISDLLIVSKAPTEPYYRATFWQAKKQKTFKWAPPRGNRIFDFGGQYNQWELLSWRPRIRGVGGFQPHSDILSNASSPSIGSFGVFYQNSGIVELNYSVAEMVVASSTSANTRMFINERLSTYALQKGDALACPDLEAFLKALSRHRIGAPLYIQSPTDKWLATYISKKCENNGLDDFMVNFAGDGPEEPNLPMDGNEWDGISVLLLKTDPDN